MWAMTVQVRDGCARRGESVQRLAGKRDRWHLRLRAMCESAGLVGKCSQGESHPFIGAAHVHRDSAGRIACE